MQIGLCTPFAVHDDCHPTNEWMWREKAFLAALAAKILCGVVGARER